MKVKIPQVWLPELNTAEEHFVLFGMVAAFMLRFDPPNTAKSHQTKANAAKARIAGRQPIKVWQGPFRVGAP
jgi:hypothetical protein